MLYYLGMMMILFAVCCCFRPLLSAKIIEKVKLKKCPTTAAGPIVAYRTYPNQAQRRLGRLIEPTSGPSNGVQTGHWTELTEEFEIGGGASYLSRSLCPPASKVGLKTAMVPRAGDGRGRGPGEGASGGVPSLGQTGPARDNAN